jgi:hypothetical protein
MNYEQELKNGPEEGQVSQNLRSKAKLKMGFMPIVPFTKSYLS